MKVTTDCKKCGKEFTAYPKHNSKAEHCSRECRSNTVIKKCENCLKEFKIKASHAQKRKTCSKSCFKFPVIPCGCCGKEFKSKSSRIKYCSVQCYTTEKRKYAVETGARLKTNCETCGKSFEYIKSRDYKGVKFCSVKCSAQRHWKDGKRHCNICGELKDENEFKRPFSKKETHHAICRICRPDYNRNISLKSNFNITSDGYDLMLKKQNGCCGICGLPPQKKRLAVDHCHTSGKIRGLLCENCNHGLGNFKDSRKNLSRAIAYLSSN